MTTIPGFSQIKMASRSGRVIRPTEKVRQQLAKTFCTAYDACFRDVQEIGESILADIIAGKEPSEVLQTFQHFQELREETASLFEDLPGYVDSASYEVYKDQRDSVELALLDVEENVRQYCSEVKTVKEEADADLTEEDISQLEEDIKKSLLRLESAKRRLKQEKASTPMGGRLKEGEKTKKTAADFSEVSPVRKESREDNELRLLRKCMESMEARTAAAELPRVEPGIFAGDHLDFPTWWATFETAIDDQPIPDSKKLLHLLSYTAEPVKSMIAGFITPKKNPLAYRQAKTLLQMRYGNPMLVADAYKCKLDGWTPIREGDGKALTKFADFLWQCFAAMDSLTYLENLNSAEENRKLVKKLPASLSRRWMRTVDRSLFRYDRELSLNVSVLTGDYPSFEQFCQFVSDEARISSGPCSVGEEDKAVQSAVNLHVQSSYRPRSNSAPSTMARKCSFCKENHLLYTCQKFLNNSRQFKEKYARDRGLCYTCLRHGHRKFDCTIKNESLMQDPTERLKQSASCHAIKGGEGELSPYAAEFKPQSVEEATCHAISSAFSLNEVIGDIEPGIEPSLKTCETGTGEIEMCKEGTSEEQPRPDTRPVEDRHYTMVLPVWLSVGDNPENEVLTYAAVDSQSDCSFVTAELASKLRLNSNHLGEVMLRLKTIDKDSLVKSYRTDDLVVRGEFEDESYRLGKCYLKNEIPISKDAILDPKSVSGWQHLRDLSETLPAKRDDLDIGMLIGFMCPEAIVNKETRESQGSSLYGVRTRLGWSFVGNPVPRERQKRICQRSFKTTTKEVTHEDMMAAFGLDFKEPPNPEEKRSGDDELFMKRMREGMKVLPNGHIQLPLPLKVKPEDLPDSRPYALKCLESVGRKMRRDDDYARMYREFMEMIIKAEMVELVEDPEDAELGTFWYWAHHGVSHPRKPGVIRGVFNGSARIRGVALNDLLLAGPDQINSLVGILIRFRWHNIPITCDIEKMFFQVFVDPEYRDLLRFVWYEGGDPNGRILTYRMKVHLFGATSSPGCANFALKETARLYEEKYGSEAADFIRDNFYVDDGLGGADDGAGAETLIRSSKGLCGEGGFNLQKYTCGDRETLKRIPEEWVAPNLRSVLIGDGEFGSDKPLGVELDLDTDEFIFRAGLKEFKPTRRSLLSCLSSIFDPLGLISPALLKGRQFLQLLCVKKFEWDARVPDELMKEWDQWFGQMEDIETIRILRKLRRTVRGTLVKIELHVFSDASNGGYGACIYLLLEDEHDNVDTTLLYAKSRVPPLKATTVPRLELQAAVLAVKMSNFVQAEWKRDLTAIFYYTDSTAVLGFVFNVTKRVLTYVHNRAGYIREHSDVNFWRHITTDRNPADLASRGVDPTRLQLEALWWEGPVEVMRNAAEAPVAKVALSSDNPEVIQKAVTLCTVVQPKPWILSVIEKYSSWRKAVGVIAVMLNWADRYRGIHESRLTTLRRAEKLVIKASQLYYLPEDVAYYSQKKVDIDENGEVLMRGKVRVKESEISSLDPFMDREGILRIGGRVKRASLTLGERHPMILPVNSHATDLLVQLYHERTQHQSANWTLGQMRQAGFWVIRGRQYLSKIVRRCVKCIRARGRRITPKMSDLPVERIEACPPFTFTGMDVFGPFLVKQNRSMRKRWLIIFACMASRGVHLEVLDTLDTSSFINSYRRFAGRRGPIQELWSDRGSNFIGGSNEINAEMDRLQPDKVKRELEMRGCDWLQINFNVPKASNMGGSWERQISMVRAAMFHMLAQHGERLTDDILSTIAVEAESIVNSRPMSYIDVGVSEDPVPLSPSALLTLKTETLAPLPGKFDDTDKYARMRWKYVQLLAQYFWGRWNREVLLEQQRRTKWKQEDKQVRVGDVVLLTDETPERRRWPLARVVEVYPGRDGRIRKMQVKMNGSLYDRPVNKSIFVMRTNVNVTDGNPS